MGINRIKSITLTCEHCSESFHPWRSDRPQRFCSRECARAAGFSGATRTLPDLTCQHCGGTFRSRGSQQRNRFCSRECYLASGTKIPDPSGYIRVYAPNEPGAYTSGQITEHRLVMQRHLGRALQPGETIHHINGDKTDNRIENLQLRSKPHGKGVRHVCADCGSTNIRTEHI